MSERVREWIIRSLLIVLTVVGVWTVFGDDLGALLSAGGPRGGSEPPRAGDR